MISDFSSVWHPFKLHSESMLTIWHNWITLPLDTSVCGNVAHLLQKFATVEVDTSCEIVQVKGHVDHPWNELCDTLASGQSCQS